MLIWKPGKRKFPILRNTSLSSAIVCLKDSKNNLKRLKKDLSKSKEKAGATTGCSGFFYHSISSAGGGVPQGRRWILERPLPEQSETTRLGIAPYINTLKTK